jgi:threonyl-tRNA synthetase
MPVRLAEYGTCYRFEKSGELFGLMRVRSLQMNDAHIYCRRDQFEEEFMAVNNLYLKYFEIFGIDKFQMRLSTHIPEKLGKKYIDAPELWIETEALVRDVLDRSGIPYVEVKDEAAFYGPKIDIQVWSAIGKEFTLATNQVDFAQGERFNLTYTTSDNSKEHPLIIHRAPLSTHERFIGFLIEHYAGNFPVWLSPHPVTILPISDKFNDYSKNVFDDLKKHDIRCSLDVRNEKIGRKIRDAELKKIPYMLIVGEKEALSGTVSVRKHKEGDKGIQSIESFVNFIQPELSLPI